MAFGDIFIKVWQARVAYKIQKSVERALRFSRKDAQKQSNIPKIIVEHNKKKDSWNKIIEKHRNMFDE